MAGQIEGNKDKHTYVHQNYLRNHNIEVADLPSLMNNQLVWKRLINAPARPTSGANDDQQRNSLETVAPVLTCFSGRVFGATVKYVTLGGCLGDRFIR